MNLTADVARLIFNYDPDTGIFRWSGRDRPPGWKKTGQIIGTPKGDGGVSITVFGKSYGAHRIAWLITHGNWPAYEIDHINGVRNDNGIANLRDCSHRDNCRNKGIFSSNSTGFKGVSRGCANSWRAHIQGDDGRLVCLGSFDRPSKAAEAYRLAAMAMFGEFRRAG